MVTEHITVHLKLKFEPGPQRLNKAMCAALRKLADEQEADFTFADNGDWVALGASDEALIVNHF